VSWPYPRIVAHRGGGSLAPENTLGALRRGAALGFRGVEFDVMLAAGGVPVLIHDETTERTTGVKGRVPLMSPAQLQNLDAGDGEGVPSLEQAAHLCRKLELWPNVEIKPAAGHETATGETVARLARELLADVRAATARINRLEREIAALAARLAPSLLDLAGCGPLTAAKLVGETAGVRRFRHRAAFARHTGTAPVPVWSGNVVRHRLSRGGNRQLNAALHRIAVTQLQRPGAGQDYLAKRRAAGDTKTEAIRALRRRLSDEVYRRLLADEQARTRQPAGLMAAA